MKLSFLFNFVYIFHQRVLCLCLFLTDTCPVTVCPVTPVLIRQKLFPLLDDSAPLKPFGLLISSLSVEKTGSERNFQLGAFASLHTWPFPGKSIGQRSNFSICVEWSCSTPCPSLVYIVVMEEQTRFHS